MFKFAISKREPSFGSAYFVCPSCGGQTYSTGSGGKCWDCGMAYRVVADNGTTTTPKRAIDHILALAAAVLFGILISDLARDRQSSGFPRGA